MKQTDGHAADAQDGAGPPQPGLLLVFSAGKPLWGILPIPLPAAGLDLGRDLVAPLVDDPRISRSHARVEVRENRFIATDLGSRNGTAADGEPVAPQTSRPFGRCLRIGNTLLLPTADINPLRTLHPSVQGTMVLGPRLLQVYLRINRVATSSTTLHITGESGAGKENAARAFHAASNATGPFVAVNCATIPEGIAERLLFGAKKGAFSGITADVEGYVQAANGGTLFLDEIAELALTVQAKLLRVLESREVLALGALKPQPVKLQICSASHRALSSEVAAKRLREDLYYRIGLPAERIPPLRERPEEISWLIDLELRRCKADLLSHVSLVEACILRTWPGNVRELLVQIRSAAQEARASHEQSVRATHLAPTAGLVIAPESGSLAGPALTTSPAPAAAPPPAEPKPEPAVPSRSQIVAALLDAGGNVSEAARRMGLHRSYLRRHIDYHGIDPKKLRSAVKT